MMTSEAMQNRCLLLRMLVVAATSIDQSRFGDAECAGPAPSKNSSPPKSVLSDAGRKREVNGRGGQSTSTTWCRHGEPSGR